MSEPTPRKSRSMQMERADQAEAKNIALTKAAENLKECLDRAEAEREALLELLGECRRFVVERAWSGCASEEDANVCLANIDAARAARGVKP
mgnify:CR=1 FL=1